MGKSFRYGDIPVYAIENDMENKRIDLSARAIPAGETGGKDAICNYARFSWKTSTDQTPHFYQDVTRIYLYMPVETDTDLQFTFALPLESPVLLATLSPIQIRALLGGNTIWSDTNGNTTVKYWSH